MNFLSLIEACLVGFFAFAAIHYAIQWWHSRNERVLGVFAILCVAYTAFSVTMVVRRQATTVADSQAALDSNVTLALVVFAVLLRVYTYLGDRRDRVFRACLVGVLALLAVVNQWVPIRGTVLELQPMQLGDDTIWLPIRSPPGVPLVVLYLAVLVVQAYGVFIARTIWKRGDRAGALLVGIAALAIAASAVLGILVDFAGVRSPHVGALPHAFFVLCMAVVLSREYAARGARVVVANRHFETVFERAPIGMALLAPDGRVLRVNHALCEMLDATADELCARRLQDLTQDHAPCELGARLLAGEIPSYAVEKALFRDDGKQTWVLLAVSAVRDDAGRAARIIAQMQDITELRTHRDRLEEVVATRTRELHHAKEDAERANAAKSTFLANVSHEIRTPLGVMMLYAQLLQRYSGLDEQQRQKVDIIVTSGRHLVSLLGGVLEMSKIEAGRAKLVEDQFDMWSMLEEVERMFVTQCTSQGIALSIERSATLPRSIHGDGGKVKQILINLVGNAVKFTKQGSIRVAASAAKFADQSLLVKIVVADTGIGIAPADLERMFQPFEQLKAGATAGGTGLGLAISRSHARLMRGDLTVQSVLGVGTTFTLELVATPGGTLESAPAVATVATRCKVLVVDDLQHNRDILVELLGQPNFTTRTAADGPDALAIHAEWNPDLVLLDLRMPEMDGLEALRRMRAAGSKAAIGVISASALADDEREALALGADFFMSKPYDERELFERIARVLAARPAS